MHVDAHAKGDHGSDLGLRALTSSFSSSSEGERFTCVASRGEALGSRFGSRLIEMMRDGADDDGAGAGGASNEPSRLIAGASPLARFGARP